jgi:hypothetical protein
MIRTTRPSRYRLAPLAMAAALALGACGGGEELTESTVPAAESGESTTVDGMRAPVAVRTAGGGGGGGVATAAAESAPAGGEMATDMMMPYRVVTFVAGDGLELPADDIGYGFEAGATVSPGQVGELAAALGVTGEPERIDDGYQSYWRVGPEDGTAPSLWVYEDAQLTWNYNSAWATQTFPECVAGDAAAGDVGAGDVLGGDVLGGDVLGGDVAVAPPSEGASDSVATPADTMVVDRACPEPEPPANVPSQADAEATAREVMTAIGLDPAGFEFETFGDEWFASVSAVERLDGRFDARRFDAGFGGEGVLQYAGGQLAEPFQVGPYPLVDLDAAVARLNDPTGFYGGGYAPMLAATDVAVASEPSPGVATEIAPSDAVAAMPVTTEPGGTVPPPEEVTVTLTGVEAGVWWAYDVDGSVWLLPAYQFTGDDGGVYTVPAVTDEFLIQVPAEDVPAIEPVPVPGDTPAPEIDPSTVSAPPTKPETMPTESIPGEPATIDTAALERSIGKSLAEFTADAEALGATVRVVNQDGVELPVTADFSFTRVNVAVEGDVVVAISSVG